jgi:hypothetical protein
MRPPAPEEEELEDQSGPKTRPWDINRPNHLSQQGKMNTHPCRRGMTIRTRTQIHQEGATSRQEIRARTGQSAKEVYQTTISETPPIKVRIMIYHRYNRLCYSLYSTTKSSLYHLVNEKSSGNSPSSTPRASKAIISSIAAIPTLLPVILLALFLDARVTLAS